MRLSKLIFSNYFNSAFILCIGFVLIFSFKDFLIHDFGNYYFGAYFLKSGEFNSDLYFPHVFNQKIAELGYTDIYQTYSPHTPFLAMVFYPLTFLPVYYAKILFNIISVILFAYSTNKLFKSFKIKNKNAIGILLIFVIPFYNGILFGQLYFLIFYLIVEGYFSFIKRNFLKTGVFWAIAIALKIFPVFLLFFLLFNKEWKQFVYVVSCIVFLFLFSLIWIDFEVWSFFITDVFTKAINGEMYAEFTPHFQSFDELLKHYFVFHPNYNPNPIYSNYSLYTGLLYGYKFLVLMVGVIFAIEKKELFFQFSYWIFAAIIFSSYGSSYSMILLLIVAFFFQAKRRYLTFQSILFFVILFMTCNLPVSTFINFNFPFLKTLLYQLILVLMFISIIPWSKFKFILGAVVLVTVFSLFSQNQKAKEKYFTFETQPGLIYNYEIKESKLIADYLGVEGEKEYVFEPEISNYSKDKVGLIDNQIYYEGKQITFSKSNKLNPTIINGNTIVYLSDYERGLGFFTLREINL